MVKNTLAKCREHEFDPWSRKSQHATEQLTLSITATEAHVCAQQKTSPQ